MTRLAAATAAALLATSSLAQVELRRGEPPPAGQVAIVDELGVTVRQEQEGAAPVLTIISWDRVRAVTGEHAAEAASLADTADRVWRARTRIERGDWRLGEPLFERLFAEYGTLNGPTSAVIAEGLLRCRLRRGAQAAAVGPWVSLVRILRDHALAPAAAPASQEGASPAASEWIGGEIDLPPIIDAPTLLAPALPPIWLPGPAVDALTNSPELAIKGGGDPVAEALADLYRVAAAFEAGREPLLPDRPASSHPGVALVRDVVAARIGDAGQRAAARDALQARLSAEPAPWIQVWCHAGIGRSLLREADEDLRRQGVLHLLNIPASYGADDPYLAGLALAESAVAMADMGDADSAAALRAELESHFSDHPALAWPPLRRAGLPDQARPNQAEPESESSPDPKGAA